MPGDNQAFPWQPSPRRNPNANAKEVMTLVPVHHLWAWKLVPRSSVAMATALPRCEQAWSAAASQTPATANCHGQPQCHVSDTISAPYSGLTKVATLTQEAIRLRIGVSQKLGDTTWEGDCCTDVIIGMPLLVSHTAACDVLTVAVFTKLCSKR